MMRFSVLSRKETQKALKQGVIFDGIISINDIGQRMPWEVKNIHNGSYVQLYFHDIDQESYMYVAPQPSDVNTIIDYAQRVQTTNPDAHILSHCVAGISRSSAAVLIAAAATGHDVEQTLKFVYAKRPHIWPNALMLEFAEEQLGKDIHTPIYKYLEDLTFESVKGQTITLKWGEHVYGPQE